MDDNESRSSNFCNHEQTVLLKLLQAFVVVEGSLSWKSLFHTLHIRVNKYTLVKINNQQY